jgi:Na+/citrate or Na+/malate symporter
LHKYETSQYDYPGSVATKHMSTEVTTAVAAGKSVLVKSLLRALIAIHYDLYQTVLALVGAVVLLHLLFDYSWSHSAMYGAVTVVSYWIGQGIVATVQRMIRHNAKSSSLD